MHYLTRRQLISATSIGIAPIVRPVVQATAAEAWSPADGLRMVGPTVPVTSLDPIAARDMATQKIVRQCFRCLTELDESMLATPSIAASWQTNDGVTEWTFALDPEATFVDGTRISPDDVVFSLTRALALGSFGASFIADTSPDRIVAGDGSVTITLDAPSSTLPIRLATASLSIVQRTNVESGPDWWRMPNGSGPYTIQSIDPSSIVTLSARASWKGETIPIRTVNVRLGQAAWAAENLFQNGSVDLVDDVAPQLVSLLEDPASGTPAHSLTRTDQFTLIYIALGNQSAPLDDVHVRRALQRLFPTADYVTGQFGDTARIPEGLIPNGVLGRAWPATMPSFDPDAARGEVAQSRYARADRVPPIDVFATDVAPLETLREVAERELGLRINVFEVGWDDFLAGLVERTFGAYSISWTLDYADPEALIDVLWRSTSAENYSGYANADVDAALNAARAEQNSATRVSMLERAQQMLIDDGAVIPVAMPYRYSIARDGMRDVPVSPLGLGGLERIR